MYITNILFNFGTVLFALAYILYLLLISMLVKFYRASETVCVSLRLCIIYSIDWLQSQPILEIFFKIC